MSHLADSFRARSSVASLAALLILVMAAIAAAPARAVQAGPVDAAATSQDRLAIVVVLVGLAGLVLFGVRRLGMRMLVSRRARRP
jgi:hypothetical protein